jgi:hypothetical protein
MKENKIPESYSFRKHWKVDTAMDATATIGELSKWYWSWGWSWVCYRYRCQAAGFRIILQE